MTAVQKKVSKPEHVARQIEALDAGWDVSRNRQGDKRTVLASRGYTTWSFTWRRGEDGNDRYVEGYLKTPHSAEPWFNVADAIRRMALPDADYLATLPAPEALAALAGRTITWLNSVSDREESGVLPRGGVHLKLVGGTLHFIDSRGFHSVRLSAITKVT